MRIHIVKQSKHYGQRHQNPHYHNHQSNWSGQVLLRALHQAARSLAGSLSPRWRIEPPCAATGDHTSSWSLWHHHHYDHYYFDHRHYNQSLKNYTSVRRYKCYFELLCSYPQELQIIAPFPQMYPTRPVNWSQSLLSSLCIPNPMVNKVTNWQEDKSDRNIPTLTYFSQVPHHPPDYYTCPFRTTKLDKLVWKRVCFLRTIFEQDKSRNQSTVAILVVCRAQVFPSCCVFPSKFTSLLARSDTRV